MIELLFIGGGAAILYGLIRFGARALAWATGNRYRAYRQLAHRYRGRYESRGMAEPPTVSFAIHGSTVRVGLAPPTPGQPSPPRTRVVIRFSSGLPFRLELAPVSRPAPPQPPKGTRPVRSGDAEFDRYFSVRANDPEMARDFLGLPTRRALGMLQRLGPVGGILLSVNPERLLVQVDRNLASQFDTLAAMVDGALTIHRALVEGVALKLAVGVEVIEAGPPAPADSGPPLCKVCGVVIEDEPRTICARCKAPHHADCWEFIGGCSIFGCNGKVGLPG